MMPCFLSQRLLLCISKQEDKPHGLSWPGMAVWGEALATSLPFFFLQSISLIQRAARGWGDGLVGKILAAKHEHLSSIPGAHV